MKKFSGSVYLNGNRYWYKVKLQGDKHPRQIPIKPPGSRFATKDYGLACELAQDIYHDLIRQTSNNPREYNGQIDGMIASYLLFAKAYYGKKGQVLAEYELRELVGLYGSIAPHLFTSIDLKRIIEYCIDSKLSLKTINNKISRIRLAFKWSASEMMIPKRVYDDLTTVDFLHPGRDFTRVDDLTKSIRPKQPKKVMPVSNDAIKKTLPALSNVVSAMVRLQRVTGMRSNEICLMMPCNIDRSGEAWIYKPKNPTGWDHKTQWLTNEDKEIMLGPQAQLIIMPFWNRPDSEYLFKPAESMQNHRNRRHEARKSYLSCGNKPGSNCKGTEHFKPCFNPDSYRTAIKRACKKVGVDEWYPHQLRHAATTAICDQLDKDDAQAYIGHADKTMTDRYSKKSRIKRAKKVALKIG